MKLSTKIFLPIILISALLISLTGCFGVPADESPGYTAGSIKGTMARPEICCEDPQGELVGDPIDPNICDEVCKPQDTIDWYAWANVKVVLTTWIDSEEVELATTVTDENGDYLFNDVAPGENYIITAICPTDEEFVVKDVAEEVVSGSSYDAGIADAESTVLALCLEGLGEIGLNSDILILNDFRSHGMYWQVVEEVCSYLADCDHAIPMWVCVITELCPGWTPGEGGEGEDEPDTYTLTMAVNPTGGGTTSPSVGSHTYDDGTVVTLTATAATCYDFVDWTGDVTSSDNPTSVTMNSNKTVTANFVQGEYTLDVTTVGEGSVTKDPDLDTYLCGTVVKLTPVADPCWSFDSWSGTNAGNLTDNGDGTYSITIDEDKEVTATFVQVQEEYTLDVTILPTEAETDGCTVTKDPDLDTYLCGTVVTLTPQEVACWSFNSWGGTDGSEVTGSGTVLDPYTITMDSDKVVTANFEQICDPPCCLPQFVDFNTHGTGDWESTTDTYFPNVELANINPGYNIWNGTGWAGWCADDGHGISSGWYNHRGVVCSIDPTINPDDYTISSYHYDEIVNWYNGSIEWNKINWIINNRRPEDTMEYVQNAIWHFTNGLDVGTDNWLVNNANGSFVPGIGDKYAVILDANLRCVIQRIFIEAIRTCCCEAWHQLP